MSKNIKANTFYNSLLVISQFLFPLVTFPYISRTLGPFYLGSVSFVDSICQTIILIAALGIPFYGVRELAKIKNDRQESNKLLVELILIHLISTSVLLLFYFASYPYVDPIQKKLMIIGLVSVISQIFMIEWYYQGLEKFKYISIRSFAIRGLSVISIFLFINDREDYDAYFLINVITVFLNAFVNFFFVFDFSLFKVKKINLLKHIKPLVYILGSSIAASVYVYLDSALLGFITNPNSVAYYSVAVKFNKIAVSLVTAAGVVLVPALSSLYHLKDYFSLNILLNKILLYVIFSGSFLTFTIFFYGGEIIQIMSGSQFDEAKSPIMILSPLVLLIGLSNIFGSLVLNIFGFEKMFFRAIVVGMLLSLILNILLISFFDYIGASITTLITESIIALITYFFVKKHTRDIVKLNFQFKYLFYAGISVLISKILLIIFFKLGPLPLFISGTIIAMTFYIVILLVTRDSFLTSIYNQIVSKSKEVLNLN